MSLIRMHRGFSVCYINYQGSTRALDKREYLIDNNFCNFSSKQYVVTPHLNHLVEMVQMRGHNIFFMPK